MADPGITDMLDRILLMRGAQRDKLFHAIVFFKENTQRCYKLKLFKLLHHLDFEMYRQTGKSTTGLMYFAWPNGPVPRELFEEISNPKPDMRAAMTFHLPAADAPDSDTALKILPKIKFDSSRFTKRELAEMNRLAEIYRESDGQLMSDVTHARKTPWHQIAIVENRPQAVIPYKLALDGRPGSVTEDIASELELDAKAAASLFK